MEQIWIDGKLRTVPPALFNEADSRAAIAAWKADPDAVEAKLAADAKTASEAVARQKPFDRLKREAAERDAGVRSTPAAAPARPSRGSRQPTPSTDGQE